MKSPYGIAAVCCLALAPKALALCQTGTTKVCKINGQQGSQECLENGRYSPCEVTQTSSGTGSETAVFYPKYKVLTVIYAPPGTKGGGSKNSVSYASSSTTGSTTTITNSFKQDYTVTTETTFPLGVVGLTGSATGGYSYSKNQTTANAIDIKKTVTNTITASGPSQDGIDHNSDEIWLWLHPAVVVTVDGKHVIWGVGSAGTADIQYLYVGWLKNPATMPAGMVAKLSGYGFTPQDYSDILKADPLAGCGPLLTAESAGPARTHLAGVSLPCGTPTPTGPRYVALNTTFPYEPPLVAGDPVPTYSVKVDTSYTDNTTFTVQTSNGVSTSTGVKYGISGIIDASLKIGASLTWTDSNSTATLAGSAQSATVTTAGPSFGYSGPEDVEVYLDVLYQTFAFRLSTAPLGSLRGVVKAPTGLATGGVEVVAVAGSHKYRTYTNARGEYRFPYKILGPVQIRSGAVKKLIPKSALEKSVILKLN